MIYSFGIYFKPELVFLLERRCSCSLMSRGMYNRYLFAKNIYKDYVILIAKGGNKYYSFDKDKRIMDYINPKNGKIIYMLKKFSVNFVVVDDLEILGIGKFKINNYYKYLYLSYMKKILCEVKGRFVNE